MVGSVVSVSRRENENGWEITVGHLFPDAVFSSFFEHVIGKLPNFLFTKKIIIENFILYRKEVDVIISKVSNCSEMLF